MSLVTHYQYCDELDGESIKCINSADHVVLYIMHIV